MTTTPNPGPTRAPEGFGIDPRIGAAATKTPAASREDYRPQAILKLQPRYSFDYRVRYEPQLNLNNNSQKVNSVILISTFLVQNGISKTAVPIYFDIRTIWEPPIKPSA